MLGLLVIDVLVTAAMLAIWYVVFSRYNRRRAARALHLVEAGCRGKARVLEARWISSSRLQARLTFAPGWFENCRLTFHLLPRAVPFQWLFSFFRKNVETVTFEADLDYRPGFHLEIVQHRWLTQKYSTVSAASKNWTITKPGPVVLTTRTQWTQELTPVVNTLMTSRGHSLLTVRFRPSSPHFAATVSLDALVDQESAASFLNVVHALAAGASTSRQ